MSFQLRPKVDNMTSYSDNQTNQWAQYAAAPFDPDQQLGPIHVISSHIGNQRAELPTHTHRNGQFVFVHKGFVTCMVDDGYWLVPAQSAMWIPAGTAHSNQASANAFLSYAFIKPNATQLPLASQLLAIPAWIRELILHLAHQDYPYEKTEIDQKMAQLLLLGLSHVQPLDFYAPLPKEPRLQQMAKSIVQSPDQRKRLSDWAHHFNCSERTLARHIQHHTGMSFSRWQQQLLVLLAMQKLGNGQAVKRITADFGYESPSPFIALFKAIVGMTPGQFSQQHLHRPIN